MNGRSRTGVGEESERRRGSVGLHGAEGRGQADVEGPAAPAGDVPPHGLDPESVQVHDAALLVHGAAGFHLRPAQKLVYSDRRPNCCSFSSLGWGATMILNVCRECFTNRNKNVSIITYFS